MDDWGLQEEYAFSDEGKTNHWLNVFVDRRRAVSGISDEEILQYVRQDNFTPLRAALKERGDYLGWRPDVDLILGFDEEGFARDNSWWRAFRYKPFVGTFWPTNGSTDDVMIRLPWPFYSDRNGNESKEIYKINLAILEAALTVSDLVADADLTRRIEPVDEGLAARDLNADGKIGGKTDRIVGLPARYVGAAARIPVDRFLYPAGTEFLHTVRYVDPESPSLLSMRMKEVRYSVKRHWMDERSSAWAYSQEKDAKQRGSLPHYIGSADAGLMNDFGWQLQGFIEDARGRLRQQTHEEHYYCMGCHGAIGVSVDQTFGFPRKVPGRNGWGHQSLAGIQDVPQAGHSEPEILTYFRRAGGGDEFRGNTEVLERFFPKGRLDHARVLTAAPGGQHDILWLLRPSRQRALLLNKSYLALVREQSYSLGRDTLAEPATNVLKQVDETATGLKETQQIYRDARLWLTW